MARLTVVHLLCALGFFREGLPALIETQQTVTAALTQDAHLSCQLTQTKEVVQVTWQKLLPEEEKFLASYTEAFGERVNAKFKDKVGFADAALQKTSIVVRNVTEQDGGCYCCIFNTYPDGGLRGRTCLQVYELHEPILHVGGPNSSVLSCSATGRPAPTVTISVLQEDLHLSPDGSVRVTNSNGTVTVNTTAVLSGHHGNGTQVHCTAQVHSRTQMKVLTLIHDDIHEEPALDSGHTYVTVIVALVLVLTGLACVCFVIFLKKFPEKEKLRSGFEETKTPKKMEPITTSRTPLMEEGNKHALRQRTPSKQSPDFPRRSVRSLFLKREKEANQPARVECLNED